jgi:hypothetical protein
MGEGKQVKIKKIQKVESRIERQIITGLIISDSYCREIKPLLKPSFLQVPFVRVIAGWCLDYFDKFGSAPNRVIEDIFREKRETEIKEDVAELISLFLSNISSDYEKGQEVFNIGYYLDKTEKYIRTVSLKQLAKKIENCAISGMIEEGEAIVKGYERIQRIESKGIDPINDKKAIIKAFEKNDSDKLFDLPGDLGKAIGEFERGWLFSFLGPAKAGKSWWLMLLGLRALARGLNVLFASFEMSEKAMTRRIHHYLNGLPTRQWDEDELLMPVFDCKMNQNDKCRNPQRVNKVAIYNDYYNKKYKPCTVCKGTPEFKCKSWFMPFRKNKDLLSVDIALKKANILKRSGSLRGGKFHLVEFPSTGYSMDKFKAYLYNLEEYEGFVPDVVITDYADKMTSGKNNRDERYNLNEVWKEHKALAQVKNILVATASQSNTARTQKEINQGDWADDIRKLNLIDCGMALNVLPDTKKNCLMTAGILANRHDHFNALEKVYVLQQYKIGRPYIDSYHHKFVIEQKK